jgi:hypothetical protein
MNGGCFIVDLDWIIEKFTVDSSYDVYCDSIKRIKCQNIVYDKFLGHFISKSVVYFRKR